MQGKVHTVDQSTGPDLQFEYNPTGHRIEKRIKYDATELRWDRYYYLRDPQGNVMAVYSFSYDDLGNDEYCRSMQLDELHVYGSSRIAVDKPQATLYKECFELTSPTFDSEGFLTGGTFLELPGGEDNTGSSYDYTITRGLKYYEISNHLGNVMSTLRDRKLPQESSGDILNFTPDVSTWQDYLPFGMLMYYRNGDDGGEYRYGFQAQERDDELKGAGNSIDYKFRMHDPRLGRFFAVDPLKSEYPWNSPFAFSENKVIHAMELEGLQAWEINNNWNDDYIRLYRNFAQKKVKEYVSKQRRYTCEDLAIDILIEFASKNGLPVSFYNLSGVYDASDEKFRSIDEYRYSVLLTTGASDLMHNTNEISKEKLQQGDLILHFNESKGRINHTQLIAEKSSSGPIYIAQGNLDFGIIRNSADKSNERRYIGSLIQTGLYMPTNGDYYRDGDKTEGLLKSKNTLGREWDFEEFNFRHDLYGDYQDAKKFFEKKSE